MTTLTINKASFLNATFADGSISLHPVLARQLFKGIALYAQSNQSFPVESIFSIEGFEKAHYQIEEVSFDGSLYSYLLTFIGYYANNPYYKSPDFISTAFGKQLTLVTDNALISKIQKENNYN